MTSHTEQQISPYSPQQLFDLVADVERYPEFLPWCRAARVLEHKDGEILAELVISFAHLTERYTSRVTLSPPDAIDAAMIKGPFTHLENRWRFTPEGGGTRIDFFLDFRFRSKLLEKLIGGLFGKAAAKMTGAFKTRADELYGKKNP
ncbi:MAG: type II toxin-antitoxin system RatA family toxin [Pseudomonadota bacterium]|nr:type II toxin-antitoxin system RatA family toxin [Pseudomonadota bacterium]